MSNRTIALHTITAADAGHVLHVLADGTSGALEPGGFVKALIEAALLADDSNKERLERGFEGLVSAVRVYKELPNGIEMLRAIAAVGRPF